MWEPVRKQPHHLILNLTNHNGRCPKSCRLTSQVSNFRIARSPGVEPLARPFAVSDDLSADLRLINWTLRNGL